MRGNETLHCGAVRLFVGGGVVEAVSVAAAGGKSHKMPTAAGPIH